ncbi:hypothetical protein K435DRAFT_612038, partial [Dendrothele bispora CBS 962.96]
PIIDPSGRIFGILVGKPPNDPTWESNVQEAARQLQHLRSLMHLSEGQEPGRQGVKTSLSTGYSFGGGQKSPKPFNQTPSNKQLIDILLSSKEFSRISGHISAAFAAWAPRLYALYSQTIQEYKATDPNFSQPFSNSAFAAATFNMDEETATVEHLNYLNYIFGWCAITALGNFDYKSGSQMILWDLKMVIEFPAGTSMLIPSGYCRHGNTAVVGGCRYSFTQYSAGGLFRY